MPIKEKQEQYAKAISLFLAELLRTRKITLERAADIARNVVRNINLIDSEEQFLKFVKVLSSDFEELFVFQKKISFDENISKRKDLEEKVRQFVIGHIAADPVLASNILQEAILPESNLDKLAQKFPQFKEFMEPKKI